jgi:ATP-dependent helicase HepA
LEWLLAQAVAWRQANEKTLVFVAHRETLEMLRDALSARVQLATGVFHEARSAARRDTEVARFREADGPSLLVSTEAGGEGRNFEFCHRLVLYDLPWKPSTVEQRIGRLDRIGRRIRRIVHFRPAAGIAPTSSGCSSGSAVPRADRRPRAQLGTSAALEDAPSIRPAG